MCRNCGKLLGVVAFQAAVIQVAEGVIDRLGVTPAYRRVLAHRIGRDVDRGEDYPAALVAGAVEGAACQGPPPRTADQQLPLDDYLGEED